MTSAEIMMLKQIRKNLSRYQIHYMGVGPNKRDEAFVLLDKLIKGAKQERSQKEFDRGYDELRRATLSSVDT